MALLFTTGKQEGGVVKRVAMVKSSKKAYLAVWMVKEKDEEKKHFNTPESYALSQFILSTEQSPFQQLERKHEDLFEKKSDCDTWNRRELGLWHSMDMIFEGKKLAVQGSEKETHIIDVEKTLEEGKFQDPFVIKTGYEPVRIFSHGENIVMVRNKNKICIYDKEGEKQETSKEDLDAKDAVRLDENRIVIVAWERTPRIFDMRNLKEFERFGEGGSVWVHCCVSPNGRYIALGGAKFMLYDTETKSKIYQFDNGADWITDIRLSNEFVFYKSTKLGWNMLEIPFEG